jgi:hypothetical protein
MAHSINSAYIHSLLLLLYCLQLLLFRTDFTHIPTTLLLPCIATHVVSISSNIVHGPLFNVITNSGLLNTVVLATALNCQF